MWQLSSNGDDHRTYTNSATGSKSDQTLVKTDKDGNKWWQFDDLSTIPYTRNFAATKISALYTLGLSKEDLNNHIGQLKKILRSEAADKYEQAYAQVLDFEQKANNATDAIKQMSALVCVYFTLNDELIDSFDNALQVKKMELLEADPEMHAFFLKLLTEYTERSIQRSNLLFQIASSMSNGNQVHSD